ncbi:MAG: hypothetical protein JJ895_01275 [Balneolaceae bacterium]|nr:hypothetical protein [Balneolaceae bacterium]
MFYLETNTLLLVLISGVAIVFMIAYLYTAKELAELRDQRNHEKNNDDTEYIGQVG